MSVAEWRTLWVAQCLLLVSLLAFFALFPRLDLQVSALFYSADQGFFLAHHPLARVFYRGIPLALKGLGIAATLVLLHNVLRKRRLLGITPRAYLYLLLVLALGPGLLVNGVLKEHWGRARPVQVEEFGGDKHYTPPLVPTDQCPRNCSFISGHAASGFYPFAMALLIPGRTRRRHALVGAIILGMMAACGRLVQGGHFLSDVLFGGLSTCLIATALYYAFFLRGNKAA